MSYSHITTYCTILSNDIFRQLATINEKMDAVHSDMHCHDPCYLAIRRANVTRARGEIMEMKGKFDDVLRQLDERSMELTAERKRLGI